MPEGTDAQRAQRPDADDVADDVADRNLRTTAREAYEREMAERGRSDEAGQVDDVADEAG